MPERLGATTSRRIARARRTRWPFRSPPLEAIQRARRGFMRQPPSIASVCRDGRETLGHRANREPASRHATERPNRRPMNSGTPPVYPRGGASGSRSLRVERRPRIRPAPPSPRRLRRPRGPAGARAIARWGRRPRVRPPLARALTGRPLGPRRRRSDPQATRDPRKQRLRRLLALPPRPGTPPRPPHPLRRQHPPTHHIRIVPPGEPHLFAFDTSSVVRLRSPS